MHFDADTVYPGPLADVLDVLLSDDLAQARASLVGTDLTHERTDLEATTSGKVDPTKLPQAARRFIKDAMTIGVTQAWQTSGTTARGTFTFDTGSLPVAITLTQDLTEKDGSTASQISGDVKVRIPLLGSTIEKKAVSRLQSILNRDTKLVASILGSK